MKSKTGMQSISLFVSIIAFIADLLTVALFVKDIFEKNIYIDTIFPQVIVIILVFIFASLLLYYSRQQADNINQLFQLFSWLYILFSAIIFGIISHQFITTPIYTIAEYLGYVMLILLIAGLGFGISHILGQSIIYYSFPFMLVALEQIMLWIIEIWSKRLGDFGWTMGGNLFLFVLASLFVLGFISPSFDEHKNRH